MATLLTRPRRAFLSTLAAILPIAPIATSSHAATFDDWGISMMDIRGVGPDPVMEVSSSNGKNYNEAANKSVIFTVEAKARCENLHWVNHGELLIYPKGSNYYDDNYASKVVIGKPNINQKTWSNNWSRHTLNVTPNGTLKKQAIAACNSELNMRVSQGGNRSEILKAGFEVIMNKTEHQLNFTCSGSSPWAGHTKSVSHNHPISVQCGAYKQQLAGVVPSVLPLFKLVSADVSMSQTNYQGTCPAKLPAIATVKTNGFGGSFQYRFLEDGNVVGSWKDKVVAKGQTTSVLKHTIILKPPRAQSKGFQQGPQAIQGKLPNINQANAIPQKEAVPGHTIAIEVKRSGRQISDVQKYQATCKTTNPPQVALNPKPIVDVPDLTSRQGITIGQHSSGWNGTIKLTAADADAKGPRGCSYRTKYDVVNIGKANATGFSSRLFDTTVIHSQENMQLEKAASVNVSGHILLRTGTHLLRVKIDDTNHVTESKENNNNFKVRVIVPKGCGENQSRESGTAIPERTQRPRPQ